jgi:hypothetical protein
MKKNDHEAEGGTRDLARTEPERADRAALDVRTLGAVVREITQELAVQGRRGALREDAWKKYTADDVQRWIDQIECAMMRLVLRGATHLVDAWHKHSPEKVDGPCWTRFIHEDHVWDEHVLYAFGVVMRFDLRHVFVDANGTCTEAPSDRVLAHVRLLSIQAITPMTARIEFGHVVESTHWSRPMAHHIRPPEDVVGPPHPSHTLLMDCARFRTGARTVRAYRGAQTGRRYATDHRWIASSATRHVDSFLSDNPNPMRWARRDVLFPEGVAGEVHHVWSWCHSPLYPYGMSERPLGYPHDPQQWGYDVLPGPWWMVVGTLAEALDRLAWEAPDFRAAAREQTAASTRDLITSREEDFMRSFLGVVAPLPTTADPALPPSSSGRTIAKRRSP